MKWLAGPNTRSRRTPEVTSPELYAEANWKNILWVFFVFFVFFYSTVGSDSGGMRVRNFTPNEPLEKL